VTEVVPDEIVAFGQKAKRELVQQAEARAIAERHGVHLEGLGGTEDGVIGSLAAVGLVSTGDDGRLVHFGGWPWPDPFKEQVVDVEAIYARGVDEVRVEATGEALCAGRVDLVKNLRPNLRGGRIVLLVEATPGGHAPWRALRPS
jgi:hypothetical protein